MPKLIVKQKNRDGSETLVWKDSDGKGQVVLASGVSPWVYKVKVVSRDKMRSELRRLRDHEKEQKEE